MIRERTDYERMVDQAMLLSIWSHTQDCDAAGGYVGDRLKLMKMAFLVAYDLYWKHIKALNAPFFRFKHGPFSKPVCNDWDKLKQLGFLHEDEVFVVTEQGHTLAQSFASEVLSLAENSAIASTIGNVVSQYAGYRTDQLCDAVYDLNLRTIVSPDRERKMPAIPLREDFTDILPEETSEFVLKFPASWETTLAIMLDTESTASMQRSLEDACNGGVLSGWESLTVDV